MTTSAPESVTSNDVTDHLLAAENDGYQKKLSRRQIQMIAIGGAIGTGLFLGAGARLNIAGPSLAIVYAICGVFAFFVVRALGELVVYRPTSGSFVSYAREFIGEKGAYVSGWLYFLVWATGGIADVTAIALYTKYWSAFSSVPQWIIALIAVAVVISINLISVRFFGEIEFWCAIIKVSALTLFLIIGIWVLGSRSPVAGEETGFALIAANGGWFPHGIWGAVIVAQGVVFAYAALEMVSIAAGETGEPREVVPKATNAVVWRIGIFYVGSVLVLAMLLPWSAYEANESPFVTALNAIGIEGAGSVMNFVVLTAALSSVNSGLYATARIMRSMATAGSSPPFTGIMSRRGIPIGGILLVGAMYGLGVFLNFIVPEQAFNIVLNLSALGILATWTTIMVCHIIFVRRAKRGELQRPSFRLPWSPYLDYITLGFLLLVVWLMWIDKPIGTYTVYAMAPLALLLIGGWFLVRKRVAAVHADVRQQLTDEREEAAERGT